MNILYIMLSPRYCVYARKIHTPVAACHRCHVGVFVRIVRGMGHVGVHERGGARRGAGAGLLHSGVALVADFVPEKRGPVQGEPETSAGQPVRRRHGSQRPDPVLQNDRVQFVQREFTANL